MRKGGFKRLKTIKDYTITDIWKKYKHDMIVPEVDEKTFKHFLYDLCQEISNMMITESIEYRIPNLGYLRVSKQRLRMTLKDGKLQTSRNIVDWKATLDYWEDQYGTRNRKELKLIPDKKVLFQTNNHTDGDIMKFDWDKTTSKINNSRNYKFMPVKGGITEDGIHYGRFGLVKWIKSDDRENDYYLKEYRRFQ